jgi:hypothetical protein
MQYEAINLTEKLAKFSDHWAPKIIARMAVGVAYAGLALGPRVAGVLSDI